VALIAANSKGSSTVQQPQRPTGARAIDRQQPLGIQRSEPARSKFTNAHGQERPDDINRGIAGYLRLQAQLGQLQGIASAQIQRDLAGSAIQ
jgi:hypothetical protein